MGETICVVAQMTTQEIRGTISGLFRFDCCYSFRWRFPEQLRRTDIHPAIVTHCELFTPLIALFHPGQHHQ